MRIPISYPMNAGKPGWPGNQIYEITRVRSTAAGDRNNSCIVRFHEHYGTHFDAPNHFNHEGAQIAQLPFDYFFYQRPVLIEIPKGADEKLTPEDFQAHAAEIAQADFLMIRTGFGALRDSDPALYQDHTPSVSQQAAQYLVQTFGATLKAICLDFVSLASPSDQSDDGAMAHKHLLGCYTDDFICIVEDADLSQVPANAPLRAAATIPLRMEGIDSGPVTAWVEC